MPAFADNIHDDVAASGPTTIALSGGTATTTIKYFVNASSGCDITSTPSEWHVSIAGAAGVTASPSNVSFDACEIRKSVVFTATSAGVRNVTLTHVSGPDLGGANSANPAAFSLTVTGSTNTAPDVSVGGVTDAASYEIGSVPEATCSVTDAQDASPSATPTLSAVTGPLSGYGLGSQTATCTYTDDGDLSDTATATYSIVDTQQPTLDTPGDQTLEATSSAGAEASWAGPTASDNVALASPASCDVASPHTFDLGVHTVNCSATDVAGNTTTGSFTITVTDTTGPSVTAPSDVTEEATSAAGASVTYGAASANDTHDGPLMVTCTPASGSTFAVSNTTVTCSATDSSGNTGSATFQVHVVDTRPPVVDVPDDMTVEATSPAGAPATFSVSATDIVDGNTAVTCDHDSGDTFDFGTTTVTCSSTDAHDNTGTSSFTVTVQDTTPPALGSHGDVVAEATGPAGATVTYTKPGATDAASTTVTVGCIPESGTTFPLGSTPVNCTATDEHGNMSESHFDVIVHDTTPPTVTVPDDQTVEATGPSGAVVDFTASASDLVDGSTTVSCSPASHTVFALGTTTVTCSSTDAAGNTDSDSFDVIVQDTTAPTLHLPADKSVLATSATGAVVSYTATADDLVDQDVSVDCAPPSGSAFPAGTTVVNCTATDGAGNTAHGSFNVAVSFGWNGFFQPVDNNGVLNMIKGGQTVPLKWNLPNGSGGWISSLDVVRSIKYGEITCSGSNGSDDIETTSTGATMLRYDTTANQYIYNWQTPKQAGKCYKVTVTLTDDSTHTALFKTK